MSSGSGFLDRHLPREEFIGKFMVPKFKFSFGFKASEVLKALGLVLPFSKDGHLSEIVDSAGGHDLYVM